jgi:hypothetical protein
VTDLAIHRVLVNESLMNLANATMTYNSMYGLKLMEKEEERISATLIQPVRHKRAKQLLHNQINEKLR